MKKYLLIAVVSITALFAASDDRIEVVPLTAGDIELYVVLQGIH